MGRAGNAVLAEATVRRARPARRELRERPASPVPPELLAVSVQPALPGPPEGRERKVRREIPALKVCRVRAAHQVHPVPQAHKEILALREPRARLAPLALRA